LTKKKGLGKGLSALIPNREEQEDARSKMLEVSVDSIYPNPNQPRYKIDENNLQELMESIKVHGLIQPIVVRPGKEGKYEIIAGERRWQACKRLKMQYIPVIVRDYDDLESSEATLVENIQREDLNAVEEASAYQKLMKEYGLTQEELSARLGKSRSFVANMLRILGLPEEVKEMLVEGKITAGHARALLSLPDATTQIKFAAKIVKQQLSVRKIEEMVRKQVEKKGKSSKKNGGLEENNDWEKILAERLGRRIKIKQNADGSGQVIIEYGNREDLTYIIENIKIS